MTQTDLPKRASYGPTSTGVNIASNTLTCFSARLGLLPHVGRRLGLDHGVLKPAEQILGVLPTQADRLELVTALVKLQITSSRITVSSSLMMRS